MKDGEDKVSPTIKLSSPATRGFWEIPVLYEDEYLLALDKPAGILTSPDRQDPQQPNLMNLLHTAIAGNKPWARERGLDYLMTAHRLDPEASGVILLAKNKPVLIALANLFGSEKPVKKYIALAQGQPQEDTFEVDAKLAPHPVNAGLTHVDSRNGKKSKTRFEVLERFSGWTLLQCEPFPGRTHQIRAHLRHVIYPSSATGFMAANPSGSHASNRITGSSPDTKNARSFSAPRCTRRN